MGLVTHNEGERAAIISSQVSGVTRVVTLFEYITEEELAKILGTDKQRCRPERLPACPQRALRRLLAAGQREVPHAPAVGAAINAPDGLTDGRLAPWFWH